MTTNTKITNYADHIPFWIKIDIDGYGKRFRLAFLQRDEDTDERMIHYPMDDFEDHWDAEHFAKYEQVVCWNADEIQSAIEALKSIATDCGNPRMDYQQTANDALCELGVWN